MSKQTHRIFKVNTVFLSICKNPNISLTGLVLRTLKTTIKSNEMHTINKSPHHIILIFESVTSQLWDSIKVQHYLEHISKNTILKYIFYLLV